MSFTSLAPLRHLRNDSQGSISITALSLCIRLGPLTLNKVGWELGYRVDIQVGDGDDYGMVRLVKARNGWALAKGGGNPEQAQSAILKPRKYLSGSALLPEMPETWKRQPVEMQVTGGSVLFRLPWIAKLPSEPSFSGHNLAFKPNGSGRLSRPVTHVASGTVLA